MSTNIKLLQRHHQQYTHPTPHQVDLDPIVLSASTSQSSIQHVTLLPLLMFIIPRGLPSHMQLRYAGNKGKCVGESVVLAIIVTLHLV
jgi:hypothetical protein